MHTQILAMMARRGMARPWEICEIGQRRASNRLPSKGTAYLCDQLGREQEISPEEEERRRVRRERNKLAAAKCRNRRKELTDFLQAETDKLEDEKSGLQREIEELQKQKERLELVLEAHRPICKIPEGDKKDPGGSGSTSGASSPPAPGRPVPCISLSPGPVLEPEALHTPTLMTTPSLTPFTPSLVFTYPSTPEPCSSAHRKSSSSSGDPSSDPLGSPTLLAL